MLDDVHAVVTGAGRGIGWTTAVALADAGARVTICDADAQTAAEANSRDERIRSLVADAASPESMEAFFADAVGERGRVGILVNNVGVAGPTALVEDTAPTDWDATLRINLNSHFYCARAVIPAMKEAGEGVIVNISSVAGQMGYPFHSAYAVSKAAVIALTNTLAMELGPHGVRANAICPCAVAGPRIDQVIAVEAELRSMPVEDVRETYLGQNSMHTFISAQDVADMVVYLASPSGGRISGQVIAVDGNVETLRPQ